MPQELPWDLSLDLNFLCMPTYRAGLPRRLAKQLPGVAEWWDGGLVQDAPQAPCTCLPLCHDLARCSFSELVPEYSCCHNLIPSHFPFKWQGQKKILLSLPTAETQLITIILLAPSEKEWCRQREREREIEDLWWKFTCVSHCDWIHYM